MAVRSICVLGGSGFVGTHLCAALARDGWRITVPTRNPVRAQHLAPIPSLKLVAADIHDPQSLGALVAGQTAVVNLVGILNERGRGGSGFTRAHVDLVRKLVEACRRGRVERLVHVSSLNADADHGPSHYLRSKGRGERIVRDECGADLAWTILQPSVIFGPRDDFVNRFARLLRAIPLALPLARPGARFAPVWIGDVVAAIQRALNDERVALETYELCGPERLTPARDRVPRARPPRPRARGHRHPGFRRAPAGGGLRLRARQAVLDRQLPVAAGRQRLQGQRTRTARNPAAAARRDPPEVPDLIGLRR